MKKIILTAISACAMASLLACSADGPADAKPQTEGPTGSLIKYDADSVRKTKVDTKTKTKSSSSRSTSSSSSAADEDVPYFGDICDGSYSSIDLGEDGEYYKCDGDEDIYCIVNNKFTTKCDSKIIDMIKENNVF